LQKSNSSIFFSERIFSFMDFFLNCFNLLFLITSILKFKYPECFQSTTLYEYIHVIYRAINNYWRRWNLGRMSTGTEVFLVAYIRYNFCRNSAKRATALYVYSCLLKTPLRKYDSSFMSWSKNHFWVKIWFIVTVVWRLLTELAKIRKIWRCQSHSRPLSK
jgi:hypothetical protein